MDGDRLCYEIPEWSPYDSGALARARVPQAAADVLGGHGLPHNVYEFFIRVPERELTVADLPDCGPAAFLGDHADGFNSFWLSLTDGTVWMRWGYLTEPPDQIRQINSCVRGFQGILAAMCDLKDTPEDDDMAYNDAVNATIVRFVSSDPEIFADHECWWSSYLLELQYTLTGMVAGDKLLYQLVRQEESGRWVLDHPGFIDEDVDLDLDLDLNEG